MERRESLARSAALALIVGVAFLAIWARIGLYADGSLLLIQTIHDWPDHGGVPNGNAYRILAVLVNDVPLLAAVTAGVRDAAIAEPFYSAGIVLSSLLTWLAAAWHVRSEESFWLLIATWGVVYLNSGFFAHDQHNLQYAMTGLAAAILVSRRPIGGGASVALVVIAVLFLSSYEAALFLGPELALLAQLRRRHPEPGDRSPAVLGVVAIILLAAGAWAAWHLYSPANAELKVYAQDTALNWTTIFRQLQFSVSSLIAAALALDMIAQRGTPVLGVAGVIAVAGAASGYTVPLTPSAHYTVRVAAGGTLFILVAAVGYRRFRDVSIAPKITTRAIVLPVVLLLSVSYAMRLVQFHRFTDEVRTYVRTHTGRVTWDDTGIDGRLMLWPWATSSLSLALGERMADAVLLPPRGFSGWVPFDAMKPVAIDPRRE